jgi:hypothetical protein
LAQTAIILVRMFPMCRAVVNDPAVTFNLFLMLAIHGFLVAWITGVPLLGLAEWGIHTFIDLGKCRGLYRLNTDQFLHILCKALWAGLATIPMFASGWRG